ncbi:MAG: cytochrome b N-terminal domain-containing protein [Planctomycetales bacterium]|nr:cytochrome b N-terminal domain-containing protein [Planctomycetales bacterium]
MLRALGDWFDNRTGYKSLVREALYEPVPGGARWRYVWGSTLVVAFVTQAITGLFLWMAYSPSTQTAWESVFYIQNELTLGWLLRGIHHFMAQAMVVLMAIHFLQVVWDGAYRAPRELNYVLGVLLMLVVLALALTGYLLPWDQKGYWATNVGTNLASQAPVVGHSVQKLAVGGSGYGHLTLTRFFALHAGVLPAALVALLVPHIALFRRHGLHPVKTAGRPDGVFWPDQVLMDAVAALGVLVVVLSLTIHFGGAELMAPADPANPYDAARPEWYFLFLFQFLKWFPGESEIWGAFIIPGATMLVLLAMPWIGRSKLGHRLNVGLLVVLLGGAAMLTAQALNDDYYSAWHEFDREALPDDADQREAALARFNASQRFLQAKEQAHREANRIAELARSEDRIPPAGALSLMYDDPAIQGPKLFRRFCASCHNYQNLENPHADDQLVHGNASAPNLYGIGTVAWIEGFVDPERIASQHVLGYDGSPFVEGDMVSYVKDSFGDELDDSQRAAAQEALHKTALALANEAGLPTAEKLEEAEVAAGVELLVEGLAETLETGMSCTDCHKFHEYGDLGSAPDLTGYLSAEWLHAFLSNPAGERFYPDSNDRMPAFAPHADAELNQLDPKSLNLLIRWLRRDY